MTMRKKTTFWKFGRKFVEPKFDETVNTEIQKCKQVKTNRKGQSESLGSKDLSCFDCPTCFEIPKGQVFQCSTGHVICDQCCETMDVCPQCRVNSAKSNRIRNRAIAEILQTLKLSSKFHKIL